MHLPAKESQAFVAHHGAREQACFEKNLESVADPENEAARPREAVYGSHDGRKPRDRSRAQIIAEGETTGENDGVEGGYLLGLVPDEFDPLADDRIDRVIGIVIAVRSGELDNSKFHGADSSPKRILAYPLLPLGLPWQDLWEEHRWRETVLVASRESARFLNA
jgi:hypothetical protein